MKTKKSDRFFVPLINARTHPHYGKTLPSYVPARYKHIFYTVVPGTLPTVKSDAFVKARLTLTSMKYKGYCPVTGAK